MLSVFIILLEIILDVYCQTPYHQSPHQAAILSDTRYLSGDGTFGAAYSQEDGVEFKEESDANGDRRGSYSYVDPTGQRRTVTYTAGKNGFQATGDHIPSAPPQVAPQPEYVPLPQYNSPDYQSPSYVSSSPQQYPRYYYPDYEAQSVVHQSHFPPQYQYQPQQSQTRYRQPSELQSTPSDTNSRAYYESQSHSAPQYNTVTSSRAYYQSQSHSVPQYNTIMTPTPPARHFYPPGKLSFNRTPDGFSYTFNKT